MWVELIQQAGEIMEFPPSFGESQLCLISKVKNIPHPDQSVLPIQIIRL